MALRKNHVQPKIAKNRVVIMAEAKATFLMVI
jgi:hypothetical protein